MEYGFDKHKIPKTHSFPLKRSVLDSHLTAAGITQLYLVYYWRRHGGAIVMRADYLGEQMRGWAAAGTTTLTIYAVPRAERHETEQALLFDGLPRLCRWLQRAERAGNVWRGAYHHLVFEFASGLLTVAED